MSPDASDGARVLGVLKGIATLLFALQLTIIGVFIDGGSFVWLVAGVLFGVVGLVATALS